jgi:glycosyltransferase involved in cell wall biosynthesis
MSRAGATIVVLGGSSVPHARIPSQMLREAGYRVLLADMEPTAAPGAHACFDGIESVITRAERTILAGRALVATAEAPPPIKPPDILEPTRRKSLYGRLALGWFRGRALEKIVRHERPVLVHVHDMFMGGMAAYYYAKRMGMGTDAPRPGLMAHLFGYNPRFAEIRTREIRLLAACDLVHTSSPVVARIYREHYELPADKLHLLVRGIDLQMFAPQDKQTLAVARAEWGIPADKFVIIHNRYLHRKYRVDVAVDAFITLAQQGHDVFLVLVRGSMCQADYEEELLAKLRAHGLGERVALLPRVFGAAQMALALQLADCSINTVPFDAFPVSILESMYCRAVPIVRDLEGYYMFVRDGETGFLCGGDGCEQYVDKIGRLIRDPQLKERIADAAVARVVAEGNADFYRRKLLELVAQASHEWTPGEGPRR